MVGEPLDAALNPAGQATGWKASRLVCQAATAVVLVGTPPGCQHPVSEALQAWALSTGEAEIDSLPGPYMASRCISLWWAPPGGHKLHGHQMMAVS
jgi:hypothetical protein